MDADKAAGRSSLAFASMAAVGLCCYALLEGCGDPEFVSEPSVPVLTPSIVPARYDVGQRDFERFCLACHGSDGRGSDAGPPLAGSPWVADGPSRLIRIVLHGVRGPINAGNGITYNREMPGVGPILPDTRIADVVTFVRRSFGGPLEAITPETVADVRFDTRDRSTYWTAEELLAAPP